MRIIRRLPPVVAFVICTLAALATERNLPLHPTEVFAEYQGQRHQVIAAEKEKPVIEVDGKRLSLPVDTPLFTERAPGYSGKSATFKNVVSSQGSLHSGQTRIPGFFQQVTAEVTADQDLSDCFLVVIHFEDEFLMTPQERELARRKNAEIFHNRPVTTPRIHVQQIEDLKAGQPAPVTFSSLIVLDSRYTNLPPGVEVNFKTFFLYPLFSGGREVRTNQPEISAAYFHHREKLLQTLMLRRWLKQNEKVSQPLKPILQIPPLLDSLDGLPTDATATLSIGSDGSVTEVKLNREFPPPAETVLNNTFRAWLFLPKIQDGVPVPSRVSVPLRF